jgi:hypothetical protein
LGRRGHGAVGQEDEEDETRGEAIHGDVAKRRGAGVWRLEREEGKGEEVELGRSFAVLKLTAIEQ